MEMQALKMEYFLTMLEKGVREVFSRQRQAAQSNVYSSGTDAEEGRSGALRDALSSPRYTVAKAGEGLQIMATLPEYARFIDMKHHGNRMVYNKHLFGTLYRGTMQDIKYEFRNWVEENYGKALRDLMNNNS